MPVIQPIRKLPKTRRAARRAICRDVIAHLDSEKLVASGGEYGRTRETTCEACALGALFVTLKGDARLSSVTRRNSNSRVSDYMRERLTPYFTRDELFDIENAFEGKMVNHGGTEAAIDYRFITFKGYGTDNEALRAIMANIIRNDRFEPLDHRGPRAIHPFRS